MLDELITKKNSFLKCIKRDNNKNASVNFNKNIVYDYNYRYLYNRFIDNMSNY